MLDKFNLEMAVMNIIVEGEQNQPPSRSGYALISLESGSSHVFSSDNFTTETEPPYLDPEGDEMEAIKITSLPSKGIIKKAGVPILEGDEILKSEIDLGDLIYETDITEGAYEDSLAEFCISDIGSSTFTSSPEIIYFSVTIEENQPPSQLGDNVVNITSGSVFVFTRSSLTEDLTPPYVDPEGNPAYQLRIDSLPEEGTLIFNGDSCYENQIINFSDIDLGLLTYEGFTDFGDVEASSFKFSVSDSVSQNFTS